MRGFKNWLKGDACLRWGAGRRQGIEGAFWEYRAHGLEVLTQEEPSMRDGK